MEGPASKRLVVALGNPGIEYEKTRHNAGFLVLDEFAKRRSLSFAKKREWKGEIARGGWGGTPYLLLKPTTFMNRSGEAIALVKNFYHIDASQVLVVVDDVDLPFGRMRMRSSGSPGTHNGLKSVADQLQTDRYPRLRIGVGGEDWRGDLADYVLSPFSEEEQNLLPKIVARGVEAIGIWLDQGITRAMDWTNSPSSNPSKES